MMSKDVEIIQLKDHEILVNNKLVIKDANDNWIAKVDLSIREISAFQRYIINV